MKYVPNVIGHIHKIDPKNRMYEKELNSHLSPGELYVINVFQTTMNLESTYDYLLCVPVFLRRFPEKQRLKKYSINRPKYINYHLHVHYIKVASILDQMSILINKVYRLGIPDKRCSAEIIIENEHTRDTNATKIMSNYNRAINSFKSVRNSIVHHGIYRDKGLNKVEMYHLVRETDPEIVSDNILKYETKEYLSSKIKNIDKDNLAIAKYLDTIFDQLAIPFDDQIVKLKI